MIEALRGIGKYSLKRKNIDPDDIISILTENPINNDNQNAIEIDFETKNNGLKYCQVLTNKADSLNYRKYLYKPKAAAGANYTPTCLISGKGIEVTFHNRIINWASGNVNRKGIVGMLAKSIIENKDNIFNDLIKKDKELNLTGCILTIKVNSSYLGDLKEFREYFINNYYENKSKISINKGTCSICGTQGFVMGNIKPWNFYSLDKPGYIASGFKSKYGWRNFPVCKKCGLYLEEGKKHVEDNLSFRFARIPYFLIPKSLLNKEELLEECLDFIEYDRVKQVKMKDLKKLADDEDEILDFASELNDQISFDFLFYEKVQQKFSIILYLQDILPSSIKELIKNKEEIEKYWIFHNAYKEKNELKNVEFNFANLKYIIGDTTIFLNIVEKVFKRRPIDYYYLLSLILNTLRAISVNPDFSYTKPTTLKSWQTLMYINRLGLFVNKNAGGDGKMSLNVINNEIRGKIEKFFDTFKETFDTDAKKAVFLTGVLVQFLLNIQKQDRGSDPFRKRIKGLKMSKQDIIKIFPEAQNKLEEYNKNYYKQLEEIIAEYFIKAGNEWNLKDDELNFYFLLGMDLSDAKDENGQFLFKSVKVEEETTI